MRALQLCLCATLLASLTACSGGNDPSEQADRALKDANLADVTIDWDKDARLAHLQGSVASSDERTRAEQVAATAVGTSGRVLNEITIRGINDNSADDLDRDIRKAIDRALADDATLKGQNVDIAVKNGVVTVKGTVASAADKGRVSELVRAAPGVKDFANALEIKRP